MRKNLTIVELSEILFASKDPGESRKLAGWLHTGRLRPLVPRVYTSKLTDDPAAIVRRNILPDSADDLITILRRRHAIILGGRSDKDPGVFKHTINCEGETVFVHPGHVMGTLKMGFRIYNSMQDPITRALFMMFLISEVHPFADGNGRIARIMMNAELASHVQTKIIIPAVYREDYMLALRRLSRQQDPNVYIRMMLRSLDFSHWLQPDSGMRAQLDSANAFREPEGNVLKWPEHSSTP